MKLPPKGKPPHGEMQGGDYRKTCHKSGNVHAFPVVVPPDDRDGFECFIGSKGHVVLTQHPPFTDEAKIVLAPVEAEKLLEVLPDAIAAAHKHRKEMT
jgi:hypothetical protein